MVASTREDQCIAFENENLAEQIEYLEAMNSELEHRCEFLMGAHEMLSIGMRAVMESRDRLIEENQQLRALSTAPAGEVH